ncbi:MAG: hypothetical protein K2X66_18645 [Cyanobacteria bacterium]|nr:hypothetical protein [Cyanobacteriota bacterium]
MSKHNRPNSRWYDLNPPTTDAFQKLLQMSPRYRDIFAQVMSTIAKRLKDQLNKQQGFASLGADKSTGLIKAQLRRRKEDHDRVIYKAINDLFIVSNPPRQFYTQRVGMSVHCTEEYQNSCERLDRLEDSKEMIQLILATVDKGLMGARDYLIDIQAYDEITEEFFVTLSALYEEVLPESTFALRQKESSAIQNTPTEKVPAAIEAILEEKVKLNPSRPSEGPSKSSTKLKGGEDGMKVHEQE